MSAGFGTDKATNRTNGKFNSGKSTCTRSTVVGTTESESDLTYSQSSSQQPLEVSIANCPCMGQLAAIAAEWQDFAFAKKATLLSSFWQ